MQKCGQASVVIQGEDNRLYLQGLDSTSQSFQVKTQTKIFESARGSNKENNKDTCDKTCHVPGTAINLDSLEHKAQASVCSVLAPLKCT